jgi:acylphosphatase
MTITNRERLHAIVDGHVQGVSFRYFTQEKALDLGLTGWVRNRYEGTVEVLAEGERADLERLLATLRRGPPSAFVTGVNFEWQLATGEYNGFRVQPTA